MKFITSDFPATVTVNTTFPVLVLVKDGWNDFGHYILYNLFLFNTFSEKTEIGGLKILDRRKDTTELPRSFPFLDENFCSLGQSLEFYEKLKKNMPDDFLDVLGALNDIAINPEIAEEFKQEKGFSEGLLRFGAAEKAFNEARLLLMENKKTVNEDLFFTYSVKVDGASFEHEVYFDFRKNDYLPYRINVLIGKNGTGKTQFLGNMVHSISGVKSQASFNPFNPLFRKTIAISYSLFDDFPKPEETTVFSYKYIGLRTNTEEIVSDEKLSEKLKKALGIILEEDKNLIWFDAINPIIELQSIGITEASDLTPEWIHQLSYQEAKRLSSGQSITLFILTELIAAIQDESLILFDEPETHLHPTAIAQLMNSFSVILEKYKSYSILSTHSPIIIQDVPSHYITIFDRQGNAPIIRKLPIESFGENISVLTNQIFETISVKELYKVYLEAISYKSLDFIEGLFENGLSMNAQLYLNAVKSLNDAKP